jgi:Na+-transporting NADH:ubiquinone oxidoreductase subunit C
MADRSIFRVWRAFLARPNDDRVKTLGIAFLVALGCGLTVSVAAVTLRPVQEANIEGQRQARMTSMLAALPGIGDILADAGADAVETRVVDLDTGRIYDEIDPATFDQNAAAADPSASTDLSRREDLAGIGRRENRALVHFVRREGELALVVLPVRGSGYQSTIRAYLALEADFDTVAALAVYEQGETPGLGARIADAPWQAQWSGKRVFDETGEPVIEVVGSGASGPHQVDGISGATVTGFAVSDMIQFWTGPRGYGPFLDALRDGEIE